MKDLSAISKVWQFNSVMTGKGTFIVGKNKKQLSRNSRGLLAYSVLLCVLLSAGTALGQVAGALQWEALFGLTPGGKDDADGMAVDNSRVYVAGEAEGPLGTEDMVVRSLHHRTGALQWTFVLDELFNENVSVAVEKGRRVFIVGSIEEDIEENRDMSVIALDDNTGDVRWEFRFDLLDDGDPNTVDPVSDDKGKAVVLDGNNLYVAGEGGDKVNGNEDILLHCLEANSGDVIWSISHDVAGGDDDVSAVASFGNHILVAARTTDPMTGQRDGMVLSFSEDDGSFEWSTPFDINGGEDFARELGFENNTVFVAGEGQAFAENPNDPNAPEPHIDVFVAALNINTGNIVWELVYDRAGGNDEPAGIYVKNGLVVVTGSSQVAFDDHEDLYVNAYNASNGNLVWDYHKDFGAEGDDGGRSIIGGKDENNEEVVFIGGRAEEVSGGRNALALAMKLADGEVKWFNTLDVAGLDDSVNVIGQNEDDNELVIAGGAETTAGDDDVAVWSLNRTGTNGGGGLPPGTIEKTVAIGSDDAEERQSSGTMVRFGGDLELVDDGSREQKVGTRFTGLLIPEGATITAAYVQFQADETDSGNASITINGEASDNAGTFTSTPFDISARPLTNASVAWSPPAWTTVGEAGPDQRTSDLSAIIQEIVNRPGWTSGNAIVLIFDGTGQRTAEAFEGQKLSAKLHIEFEDDGQGGGNLPPAVAIIQPDNGSASTVGDPVTFEATALDPEDGDRSSTLVWNSSIDGDFGNGGGPFNYSALSVGTHTITATATDTEGLPGLDSVSITVSPAGGTMTIQVAVENDSSDDAEERQNSSLTLYPGSSDLELVVDRDNNQKVGLRFNGVTIPNGAAIISAHVQFQVDEASSGPASINIQAEDSDNPGTFSGDGDISARTLSGPTVNWQPPDWPTAGDSGPDQQTSNLATIIQAIVNRGGWTSGNSLVLVFSGSGTRIAESSNGSHSPVLEVEYTTP